MSTFGENIKKRREKLGLSQDDLARRLGYKSKSTISKIESGRRDIGRNKVAEFAQALGTTPAHLMGWVTDTPTPTAIKRTMTAMHHLNDDGQEIVANTAEGLDKSGQYKRNTGTADKVMELPESYFVDKKDVEGRHISHSAAAGRVNHGVYNGIADDDILVRKSEDRPRFDDLITAKGDSMEPEIHDGDGLFIRWQQVADTGDIVVAKYQDEVFVKEYVQKNPYTVILRSFNPDYADIEIDCRNLETEDEFRIIGLVVDWETPIGQDQLI